MSKKLRYPRHAPKITLSSSRKKPFAASGTKTSGGSQSSMSAPYLQRARYAGAYWRKLKQRLGSRGKRSRDILSRVETGGTGWQTAHNRLCQHGGIFRIIQSIPSPKAEPFKRWLAQVGYERVQEIEDPELASARARELYEAKGYPEDWIEKRMRSIAVRGALTDEWKARGVAEGREYSILTAEIARATFGVTPGDHKKLKGLEQAKAANLRDHMTDLELIFTMLGEAGTTEIAKRKDAQGLQAEPQCRQGRRYGRRQRPQGTGNQNRRAGGQPAKLSGFARCNFGGNRRDGFR